MIPSLLPVPLRKSEPPAVTPKPVMQERLHKYRRDPKAAEKLASKQITDRSLEIIATLVQHKMLPTSVLLKLIPGYHNITSKHLQVLFHRGLINRFTFPRLGNPGEFHYYLDNPAALNLLVERGWAERDTLPYDEVRNNREKEYSAVHDPERVEDMQGRLLFLKHEVMIARFHAMLEMACRARSDKVELIHFRQGPALWNNVEAPKVSHDRATDSFCELAQNERLPHRPDAFFTLRFTDRSGEKQDAHFFYEADRKHTSTPKFNRKLRAHFHYIVKQKKHWEQYGVDRIRAVLIETTDGHWAETLRSAAQHPLVSGNKPSPLFWFTPSTLFTRVAPTTDSASKRAAPLFLEKPGIIFERIWATPADDTLHSLLD